MRRFHLFAGEYSQESFEAIFEQSLAAYDSAKKIEHKLTEHYLGFVSIRPMPAVPVGRTVLRRLPNAEGCMRDIWATADHSVHLANLKLTISDVAFQQQDRAVGACSTAVLWSTHHNDDRPDHGRKEQGHGAHGLVEVTVHFGDRFSTVVARPSDSIGSIKERALVVMEFSAGAFDEFVLQHEGQEVANEVGSLEHLLGEKLDRRVEFHLQKRPRTIHYSVSGRDQATTHHYLGVRTILENAGFTPATGYTLRSEDPPRDFDSDYDQHVTINWS